MRFMLTFRIPMETGNKMIKDGSLPETIQTILEDLKPEAAYFSDIEGARGGYLVINMDDASQMPALRTPLPWAGRDHTGPSRDGPRGP